MKRKLRGFTLVELLIVIVVVGILSVMMIISAAEAVSTAKVAAVISNLRNLKTAVTAWYFDNTDKIEIGSNGVYRVIWGGKVAPVQEFWESRTTAQGMESIKTAILQYMSNVGGVNRTGTGWSNGKQKIEDAAYNAYCLEDNGYDTPKHREQWFIGYVVKGDERMKRKFAGRAKSVGLLQTNSRNSPVYTDGDIVWMRIFTL